VADKLYKTTSVRDKTLGFILFWVLVIGFGSAAVYFWGLFLTSVQ